MTKRASPTPSAGLSVSSTPVLVPCSLEDVDDGLDRDASWISPGCPAPVSPQSQALNASPSCHIPMRALPSNLELLRSSSALCQVRLSSTVSRCTLHLPGCARTGQRVANILKSVEKRISQRKAKNGRARAMRTFARCSSDYAV